MSLIILFFSAYILSVRASDFEYDLPPELIAQTPIPARDQSRLLVLHRATGKIEHRRFPELLDYLTPGDVLVLNDSKVIRARLRAVHAEKDRPFEVLLVQENATNDWWTMMKPGRRAPIGTKLWFKDSAGQRANVEAIVTDVNAEGHRRLTFSGTPNIGQNLGELGEMPVPPYIRRKDAEHLKIDLERYQTIYAATPGSVAAPTAGLHFTEELLKKISANGVRVCYITLHVGLGTFAPVKTEDLDQHIMHDERFSLAEEVAQTINTAKQHGRRVVAVGTTSVRVLETIAAQNDGRIVPASASTSIFIYPPFQFRCVDALLTNFHLPHSTLLMLVSAFASPGSASGHEMVMSAYTDAIRQRYRFYSYGDAMILL